MTLTGWWKLKEWGRVIKQSYFRFASWCSSPTNGVRASLLV